MANVALGIVGAGLGAGIGSFFGAAGIGASWGWALGTVVGGILFPPKLDSQIGRLDDRRVMISSYGAPIPQVWGLMRVGGNVIWAEDLQEINQYSGGKNSQLIGYRYIANCALLVCKGPITRIRTIYANDRIIYDYNATPPSQVTITTYLGDEIQVADPYMVSALGAGNTPAYRGSAYVVMENFDVTPYGSQLPNLSFEVEADIATSTVGNIVYDILTQLGVPPANIDTSQGIDPVVGFLVNSRTDGKSAIENLLRAYAYDLVDVDGLLRLVKRGSAEVATISEGELGATSGDSKITRLDVRRTQELELPAQVDVTYYCQAKQYQQGLQHAVRQTKLILDSLTINIPCTLPDDLAKQVAERQLYTAWLEREQYRINLPFSYLYLSPGDIINLPVDGVLVRVRCDEVDAPPLGEIACICVRDYADVLYQVAGGGHTGSSSTSVVTPVPSSFFAFAGPELVATDGFFTGFYVVAGPVANATGWPGVTVYYSTDSVNYIQVGIVTQPGAIGVAQSVLAAPPGGNPDNTDTVQVLLSTGTLEPATQAEVNAGLNQFLLGPEVLGAVGASLGAPMVYTLSGLTRGELSTPDNTHTLGEAFCGVTTATRITVPDALAGTNIWVKCAGPYDVLANVTAQEILLLAKSGGPGGGGGGGGGTHALLDGSVNSDTVAHTPVAGDMIVANGAGKWGGVGIIGVPSGDVWTNVAGTPGWAAPSGGGGGAWTEQSISGATTLTGTGPTVAICDNSSSAYTVSIPSGAGYAGNLFVIKRTVINSNQITIGVQSGGTIEGIATPPGFNLGAYQLAYGVQFESVILESNGTEYKIIGVVPVYTGGQQGPVNWNTAYVSTGYVVAGTDVAIVADATSGSFSVVFPNPTAANVGRLLKVAKIGSSFNAVTCQCASSLGTEFNHINTVYLLWTSGPGGSTSPNFVEFLCVDEGGTYTWRAFAYG